MGGGLASERRPESLASPCNTNGQVCNSNRSRLQGKEGGLSGREQANAWALRENFPHWAWGVGVSSEGPCEM